MPERRLRDAASATVCTVLDGLGFPNRSRTAAATALTGFQLAITCIQPGMPWVGTMAFETIASGNKTISPTPWADSGPFETMPRQAQPHDKA